MSEANESYRLSNQPILVRRRATLFPTPHQSASWLRPLSNTLSGRLLNEGAADCIHSPSTNDLRLLRKRCRRYKERASLTTCRASSSSVLHGSCAPSYSSIPIRPSCEGILCSSNDRRTSTRRIRGPCLERCV